MTTGRSSPDQLLARALRPFAKVEPSEAVTALILTVTVFVLLTAYYLLKTAREPLILLHGGAEVKSYAAAGQAALLVLLVRAYGSVAKRVGPSRLLASVYLFFAANLVVFALLPKDNAVFGVAFYLWVGVFNYTSIAQFWALAADLYTPAQGKRIFAILGVGSSLGAVLGARIAKAIVHLGPAPLMLSAGGMLVLCVVLLRWASSRGKAAAEGGSARVDDSDTPLVHDGALKLLLSDRYLLLIAALTLLLNWVNSTGEYILDRTLLASVPAGTAHAQASTLIGAFKADYFGWINLIGVLVQLFLVSRILARWGVRVAILVLPVVSLVSYGAVVAAPVLALLRLGKIAENSIDYSLQNTARQALYLVTSRVEKYVGKTSVDTVFVRLGDVLTAGMVWVGTRFDFSTRLFAVVNVAVVVGWMASAVLVGREQGRRVDAAKAGERGAGADGTVLEAA